METLKSIGGTLLGVAIFAGIIISIILFFAFGAEVAFKISPYINWFAGILLLINIVLLFFAIIPQARGVVGLIIFISSYVYGLSAWIFGLAVTLALWGWIAVIIGLLIGGVGVVPIGMLASIFHGEWGIFWSLLFAIVLTYGSRVVGVSLVDSADNYQKDDVIDIEPENNDERTWGDLE